MEFKILEKLRFPVEKKFYDNLYNGYCNANLLLELYRNAFKNFQTSISKNILSGMFKITSKTAPKIFKCFEEVKEKLFLKNLDIQLFLTSSQDINAFALVTDNFLKNEPPVLILNAGIVKTLNEDELKFVLGHEIAHVLFKHSILGFVFVNILNIFEKCKENDNNIQLLNIINSFQHWEQLSEISADRVGLFVVDDNKNAVTSLIKLTHGLSDNIIKIDYEEVMKEIDNIFSESRYFHIDSSHPALIIRIKLIEKQAKSRYFENLKANNLNVEDNTIEELLDILSLTLKQPDTQLSKIETDFLRFFGLLVMLADGAITKDEYMFLSGILAVTEQFPTIPEIGKDLSPDNFKELLDKLAEIIVNNFPERKEILFNMLVDVALADGEYTESEHNLLFDLGKKLQMTNQEISNIILKLITNKFLPKKM